MTLLCFLGKFSFVLISGLNDGRYLTSTDFHEFCMSLKMITYIQIIETLVLALSWRLLKWGLSIFCMRVTYIELYISYQIGGLFESSELQWQQEDGSGEFYFSWQVLEIRFRTRRIIMWYWCACSQATAVKCFSFFSDEDRYTFRISVWVILCIYNSFFFFWPFFGRVFVCSFFP